MQTEIQPFSAQSAAYAAELLAKGKIVAVPTETVYGLAANVFDERAVANIFKVKGRPQDNPLIVHVCSMKMLKPLVKEIPSLAEELAERFWGGPMTMIFKRSERISDVITGGLDTVAIRMPESRAALEIIKKCGFPLAAPSANTSGKPSPTSARHVYEDLNGKIPLIIDGGECPVGVESTVICLEGKRIHILRPGGITAEMLSEYAETVVDNAVTSELKKGDKVLSPGMKYKHYSPKADVYIVDAHGKAFEEYCVKRARVGGNIIALGAGVEEKGIFLDLGSTSEQQARRLFSLLRRADEMGAETVLVEMPEKDGVGLAVYNRLLRAAGYKIVDS